MITIKLPGDPSLHIANLWGGLWQHWKSALLANLKIESIIINWSHCAEHQGLRLIHLKLKVCPFDQHLFLFPSLVLSFWSPFLYEMPQIDALKKGKFLSVSCKKKKKKIRKQGKITFIFRVTWFREGGGCIWLNEKIQVISNPMLMKN